MVDHDRRRVDPQKELIKAAIKESLSEWADEKYKLVGKWTVGAIGVAVTTFLVHAFFALDGATLRNALHPVIDPVLR